MTYYLDVAVSVPLLVIMIVLLCLVVDVIVFVSEQNTRIGHLSPDNDITNLWTWACV